MKLGFSSSPIYREETIHFPQYPNDGLGLHQSFEEDDNDENYNSDNYDFSASPIPSSDSEQSQEQGLDDDRQVDSIEDLPIPSLALETEGTVPKRPDGRDTEALSDPQSLQQSIAFLTQIPRPIFRSERQPVTKSINPDDTSPRKPLRSSLAQLKVNSQPLTPYDGLCANDVYIQETVVLKPGERSAVAAVLSFKIARLLGLAGTDPHTPGTIPLTLKGPLPALTSRNDADIEYEIIEIDGIKCAVNVEVCSCIQRGENGDITFITNDREYSAIPESGGGYKVQHKTTGTQHPEYGYNLGDLITIDDATYIVPQDAYYKLNETKAGYTFIRDDVTFTLAPCEKDGLDSDSDDDALPPRYTAVAKHAFGTIQERVSNLVSVRRRGARNQAAAAVSHDDFVKKIDSKSFINAFLMSVLVRPEDGKAHINGESNYLFSNHNEAIHLSMIDLDEAWPTNNEYKEENHQEMSDKSKLTARLQLGLMGFDLAHQPLRGDDREHAMSLINTILVNKESMLALVNKYSRKYPETFGDPGIQRSFEETLKQLRSFYQEHKENDFTLASLCFALFPTYREQWDALKQLDIQKDIMAANIGLLSLDRIKARLGTQ